MRGRDFGFKPNRVYGLRRFGACCAECLAAWFQQGLHRSDCGQRPRQLPLGTPVVPLMSGEEQ